MYEVQLGSNGYSVVDPNTQIELFTYPTRAQAEAKAASLNKQLAEMTGATATQNDTAIKVSQNMVNEDTGKPLTSSQNTTSTTGTTSTVVQTASTGPGKRQYNPLSRYSSVTYRISLYAITPEAYNRYYQQGKWVTKDLELIVQSAGYNPSKDSPRNKYFSLDYYIDDLEITTLTNAKDSGVAGNQSNFDFKIYEPYAMNFPSRLVQAEVDIQKRSSMQRDIKEQIQALSCPFLLVVRFYGYDKDGNLITTGPDISNSNTKTDVNAAFERAFPITITKFSFKLENKTTVYQVQAKLLNEQIGLGIKRGVVKTGFEISADTVKNALTQQGTGLMAKINDQQKQITNTNPNAKKQELFDEYKIQFEDDSIGESLIVDKDFYSKTVSPMADVEGAGQVTVKLSQSAKSTTVTKSNRVIKIAEGTPILTAIDQIITQSSYIRDAMTEFEREDTNAKPDEDTVTDNQNPKQLYWYYVKPKVKVKGRDKLRNDYAYEITYSIRKYQIPYVRSLVTGKPTTYYGPHKIYQYWYTGKNTEILSYDMSYNLLYYNAGALSSETANGNLSDTAPNMSQPGQNADPTNKLPQKGELENNIKTFLYSPGDQLKAQIKILGDPDYLMPAEAGSLNEVIGEWYGDDLTINASSGQVFIEIGFNEVEDYDTKTGLMLPKNNVKFWNYSADIEKKSQGRMIYMLVRVLSKFSNGVFTQELKTILPNFTQQKENPEASAGRELPNGDGQASRNTQVSNPVQNTALNEEEDRVVSAIITDQYQENLRMSGNSPQDTNDDNAKSDADIRRMFGLDPNGSDADAGRDADKPNTGYTNKEIFTNNLYR